jgi:hypothetical protein
MDEGIGDKDQHALCASGEQEAMDDETGFDGLSQAHFVGEQDAGCQASGDFGGDAELVRDQVDAATDETADAGFAAAMLVSEGSDAQMEVRGGIDIASQQALFGSVEGEGVGEFGLGDLTTVGAVEEEAATFDDGFGGDGGVVAQEEGIALVEEDASEGGVAEGVFAGFLGGAEANDDGVRGGAEDGAEAELGFGFADPALAGEIGDRHVTGGRGRAGRRRFKRGFAEARRGVGCGW